jgi:hypothetical protein
MTLGGIVYLHDISQARVEPAKENLEMFNRLCRPSAVKNVAVVTTKWSETVADTGLRREQQLSKYGAGPHLARFDHSQQSAWAILDFILSQPRMDATLLQKDLATLRKHLAPKVKASSASGFFSFLFGRRRAP